MDNFEQLETGQVEMMHNQTHDRQGEADNCDTLRQQHDSLAAELVKRGILHDTEMICPESELGQAAPNYRHGFTDDICNNCAFGQLHPFCNLYKAEYTPGYTCDSFRYFEIMELEPPHGFLMANGKQTACAGVRELDTEKSYIIVSGGEAFGVAEFERQPVSLKTKEFDLDKWLEQHRITPRERRQWWPDNEAFYVYRLKSWRPYEGGIKLYEDGVIIDEPRLTAGQWQLVSKAKELPKQIVLTGDAVSVSEKKEFVINLTEKCEELDSILSATYQTDVRLAEDAKELIPLYSLALVRNPRMRVSKKNLTAEAGAEAEKQEGEDMPYRIVEREDEYCVVEINADDTDGEVAGCHETEAEAEAQLAALRINVEAEEGEGAAHTDKPKKRKPHKKEFAGLDQILQTGKKTTPNFLERLKLAAKSIIDLVSLAETEKENEVELFMNEAGIGQKMVNGELWHLTYSTNAFKDREGETFSTKSLEQYVMAAKENEDRGFFNLWHIAGSDFAKKEWQEVIGRFLVEAGPYLDNERGQAAAEFFKQYGAGHPELAPEGWGCSPEFKYLPEERATTVYENIWITRTSTLPKMAAANIWTETRQLARKDMSYSEDQIKTALEVFKDEDFVKALFAEGETKTAELEAAGVAHKENDSAAPTPEPAPQEIEFNMDELAAQIGKQFQADLTPIAEAIVAMTSDLKEMDERLQKLEETKQVKDKTEMSRFVFQMRRASEDPTTVADGDKLKDQKPNEAPADSGDTWSKMFNK